MLDIADKNALALMNANKCKFIHLSTYFDNIDGGTTFNIIVDTNKIFEGFRRSYQKPMVDKLVGDKLDHNIAAEVMNWIVHYRRYFNRKNCRTKFFILHGTHAAPEKWNTKYSPHKKYLSFIMEKRVRPIASLAPDIYIINTDKLSVKMDGISVPYIISHALNNFKKGHNLIISDDDLAYQLLYQMPNASLLKLSSNSLKLVKGNIFDYLSKGYKTSLKNIPDWYINIYLALMGVNDIPPIDVKLKKLKILKGLADLAEQNNGNEKDITAIELYNIFHSDVDISVEEFESKYNTRINLIDNQRHLDKDNTFILANEIEEQLIDGHSVNNDHDLLNQINTSHYGSLIETIVL